MAKKRLVSRAHNASSHIDRFTALQTINEIKEEKHGEHRIVEGWLKLGTRDKIRTFYLLPTWAQKRYAYHVSVKDRRKHA